MMLVEMGVGLSVATAAAAPKLHQIARTQGEGTLLKLLLVVLRAFIDSVKVPTKPDGPDLLELAEDLAATYTHDSLKDIVLALKEARMNGTKFYQALDTSKIKALIIAYFERKAEWLENRHLDRKAVGSGQEAASVRLLGDAAPKMLENVALRIPKDHPNAEALRDKLRITKGKEDRGLITPEQAEQQRAEVRKVTTRKERKDWKPSTDPARAAHNVNAYRRENGSITQQFTPRDQ